MVTKKTAKNKANQQTKPPIAGSVEELKQVKGKLWEERGREYDMIIIGAGCAGYSAAVYAARFNLRTIVIGKEKGGLLMLTHLVENYPPLGTVTGPEMMESFEKHVKMFDVPIIEDEVTDVRGKGMCFEIVTSKNGVFVGKTVLFATGTKRRKLGVPGEEELSAKGVSYCATCDAAFFKNKTVCVVGGSDSAAKEALLLAEHCKKVYIIYRGEQIHPEPVNGLLVEEKVKENKITVITKTNVTKINGTKFVESVTLDNPYKGSTTLALDGVFIEIGGDPQSTLAAKLGVKLNDHKEIIIDREARTNVEGIYAAGDVCDTRFKQAITGAAEGVFAAFSAYTYLGGKKIVCM